MSPVHSKRASSGQISILVGIMMMTFVLFFAFVINTGILVNARINLQNAADLAAYSGAAVQARQLTHISYINYEMRRAWKKFLFRIYVLGNMAQPSFSTLGGGAVTYVRYLQGEQHPITCIIFDSRDNFCQVDKVPRLEPPSRSIANMDAMTNSLRNTILNLDKIKNQKCVALADSNMMVNFFWLYNTDPNLASLTNLSGSTGLMAQKISGIISGLGVIPKEILLRARINTLASYVNAPPQRVTLNLLRSMQASESDPSSIERTAQAFYSAFYTLGNHTFPAQDIEMTELMNSNLLKLDDIRTPPFTIYAMGRTLADAGDGTADCINTQIPTTLDERASVTVGVSKDPSVLTYYAIQLKAKAKLLFSPLGELTLKAYAAAQPFGSRIGPPASEVQWVDQKRIPNAAVFNGEKVTIGTGWDQGSVLRTMCTPLNNCQGQTTLTYQNITQGYQAAMAPNPWEGNKYNIINDLNPTGLASSQPADPFIRNFVQVGNTGKFAMIWAPIVPPGSSSEEMKSSIANAISDFFSSQTASQISRGASVSGSVDQGQIQSQMTNQLERYIKSIQTDPGGEEGETINILPIRDPFSVLESNPVLANSPTFIQSRREIATSWNNTKDGNFAELGRMGYSTKFIPFSSLMRQTIVTSSWNKSNFQNGLQLNGEAEQDVPRLTH